jgi:hypothetical protein
MKTYTQTTRVFLSEVFSFRVHYPTQLEQNRGEYGEITIIVQEIFGTETIKKIQLAEDYRIKDQALRMTFGGMLTSDSPMVLSVWGLKLIIPKDPGTIIM